MVSCIRADLRRAFRRIPRLIVLALLYGLLTYVCIDMFRQGGEISVMLIILETYVIRFIPLVFGLIELSVVFADDFNAKSMQTVIGMGVSRRKVVLSKLVDVTILLSIDILLFGLLFGVTSGIFGPGLKGMFLNEFVITLFVAWLQSVAYVSLSMILAFYSQNALFAMLVHIALASGAANKVIGMALGAKALAPLHLDRFLLTTEANTFCTHLLLGRFNAGALFAVLLYIAAGVAATWYLYSSIELEL